MPTNGIHRLIFHAAEGPSTQPRANDDGAGMWAVDEVRCVQAITTFDDIAYVVDARFDECPSVSSETVGQVREVLGCVDGESRVFFA